MIFESSKNRPYFRDKKCEVCKINPVQMITEFEISIFRGDDIVIGVCRECMKRKNAIKKIAKQKEEDNA